MNTIKVKNIAELKTRKGTSESTVEVLGYYVEGDKGGGTFYWDNTSIETDNGGTIIQVTSVVTGRWKRIVVDFVNIKAFGVYENGATDDSQRIQIAINSVKNLEFNNKTYLCNTEISLSNNNTIRFANSVFTTSINTDRYFFNISSNNVNLLGKFTITCTVGGNNCLLNGITSTSGSSDYFNIENAYIENLNFAVLLFGSNYFSIGNLSFKNLNGFQGTPANGGDGLVFVRCKKGFVNNVFGENILKAGVYFSVDSTIADNEDITINNIAMSISNTTIGHCVGIRSAVNLKIGNIISSGGISALYLSYDLINRKVKNIDISSITCNNNNNISSNSYAVYLTSFPSTNGGLNAENININNIYSYNSNKGGLIIDKCKKVRIGSVYVDTCGTNGVYFIGAEDVIIKDIVVKASVSDGIRFASTISKNIQIGSIYLDLIPTGFYGIRIDDGIGDNIFIENINGSATNSYIYILNYGVLTGLTHNTLKICNLSDLSGTPVFYNATLFPKIINNRFYADDIPSSPSSIYAVGDIIYSTNLNSTGALGWVCMVAGSAGTWSRFGNIELLGSVVFNPPSLVNLTQTTTTITVTGATVGDHVVISFSLSLEGVSLTGYVSSSNTVTAIFSNNTGATVDLASGTLKARIIK